MSPAEIEAELAEILFETGSELRGIYSIASMHDILGGLILKHSLEGRYKIVVHGISPRTEMYLRSHAFTAALHQNPILQGYYAVRILEKYLETGYVPPRLPTVSQGIVLGSNIGEEENFALFASLFAIEMPEFPSRP